MRRYVTLVVCLVFGALALWAVLHYRSVTGGGRGRPRGGGLSGELVIFHAGSLSVPFRDLGKAFRKKHPGVTLRAEAAGSCHCARTLDGLDV